MNKYVKFINETTVEPASKVIEHDSTYTSNPNAETLLRYGYKPLEETEPSGEPAEGWHWEQRYVELDDKVVKTWVQVENPVQEVVEEPIGEGGE